MVRGLGAFYTCIGFQIRHILCNQCVSKGFRTGRLEQELQMVQLSATGCSCIAVLCL